MRTRSLIGVLVLATIVVATAAGRGSGGTATVKIPLPAPNTVQVSSITVNASKPPSVSATNAAKLGSPALNTQAVAEVVKKNGHYVVLVVAHRFPPVMTGTTRRTQGAAPAEIDLVVSGYGIYMGAKLNSIGCGEIGVAGLDRDTPGTTVTNLVPTNDTPAEEQLDAAIDAKCAGAEKPDGGTK